MSQFKKASLQSIGGGAVEELFNKELETVIKNIADVNAPAKSIRKIVLEVVFKPTEDRESAAIEVKCKSTVASTKPASGSMFFSKEGGKPTAYTNNPRQSDFFENVEPLNGAKGEPVNA